MTAADEALQEVQAMLDDIDRQRRVLGRRLARIREGRSAGDTWHDILAEEEVSTVEVLSVLLSDISKASGTFRRALTAELREEGISIPGIARLYGVTHQRVSNLLRQSSARRP